MKFKRVISFIIACLLVISALFVVGCENGTDQPAGDSSALSGNADTSDEGTVSSLISILDSGAEDYIIIRGSYALNYEIEAAKAVNGTFRTLFPSTWDAQIFDDFIVGVGKTDVVENDKKEILIGETNRKESIDTLATLSKNTYVVKFVGNKLVIIGYDQYATLTAANAFIEEITKLGQGADFLSLDPGFMLEGVSEKRKVPIYEGAQYRFLSWNLGCYVGKDAGAVKAVNVIMPYLPDIIATQESNKDVHVNILKRVMANETSYTYADATHPGSSTYCYTPIIYNKTLFEKVESGVEWLDGRYTGTNTKSLAWAVFKDVNGITFGVINFHGAVCSSSYSGYEKYTDAERSEIAKKWRLDNVRQIIEVRDRIFAKYGQIPLTVNGDCNFNDSSDPYAKMLAGGFYDSEKVASGHITTGFTTSYSYGNFSKSGKSIDHFFGINNVKFISFEIIRTDDVKIASDHCPIYTDLVLPAVN